MKRRIGIMCAAVLVLAAGLLHVSRMKEYGYYE